ncbi:MAG: hypothetical protein KAT58_11560 [candidate division Zixibacteria bacterium]|nr:hypothetical protein [candidate division Zixibacteria bacterium]
MTDQVTKKKKMGKGCKVALIIFGLLLLLLIAAVVVGYFYCEKIGTIVLEKMVDQVEQKLLADLPDGFEEQDVKTQLRDFRELIRSGALKNEKNAKRIEQLGQEVSMALSDGKVDADELERILKLMREFGPATIE